MLGEDAIKHYPDQLKKDLIKSLNKYLIKLEFRYHENMGDIESDIIYRDFVQHFCGLFIELGQYEEWSNEILDSAIKDLFNLKGEFMSALYQRWVSQGFTPINTSLRENVSLTHLGLRL